MVRSWPFTARFAQIDTIVATLQAASAAGVIVAGDAGVGKSRLLAEALARLEKAGFRVVRASATGASAVPLGPFAQALPAELPIGGKANLLRWAADALRTGGPFVLAVDDAHLLDASSAALVHHLVVHRFARLVATIRLGESMPTAVRTLWKDELAQRMDLVPLTLVETVDLLEIVLEGQVEHSTGRRLWRTTEGNLLFLRELVHSGLASGGLVHSQGVWRWQGGLTLGTGLTDLIGARLAGLAPTEREGMEFVAFGEPLDADVLDSLVSRSTVVDLEDRGLIATSEEGGRLRLRVAHPLFGEEIRARTGRFRARARMDALARVVERTGTLSRNDVLRVAVWKLDGGDLANSGLLSEACQLAWAAHDVELAVRLGRAAADSDGAAEATARLGMVLYFAGYHEEAESRLLSATERAPDDRVRALCGIARVFNVNWGLDRPEDADRILDDLVVRLTEPRWRQAVRIQRASVLFYRSELSAAGQELERARATTVPGDREAAHLAAVDALVLGHSGLTTAALELTNAALGAAGSWTDEAPNVVLTHHHARVMAAVFAGELNAAQRYVEIANSLVHETGNLAVAVSTFSALSALTFRLRGRVGDALRWSRDAVSCIDGRSAVFAGLCLGENAHAAALSGDVEAAEARLAEAETRSMVSMSAIDFPARLARTWAYAARGEIELAVRHTLNLADVARGSGLAGYQLFALHDATRLGAADLVADRLVRLADEFDGSFAALCARQATAARDATAAARSAGLEQVAADFEVLGMLLFAAEAAAQAAAGHRTAGRERRAHAARTHAWLLVRQCQGARTPAVHALLFPRLTRRQWQIGRLAADGLTNREIAERLVISPRTAANHLVALYERLGVNDRAQLARILASIAESE